MAIFKKTYGGGWDHFGEPEFDDSSVSGGKPDTSDRSKKQNTKAAKAQAKLNAQKNCRKCKPERGIFCPKHA